MYTHEDLFAHALAYAPSPSPDFDTPPVFRMIGLESSDQQNTNIIIITIHITTSIIIIIIIVVCWATEVLVQQRSLSRAKRVEMKITDLAEPIRLRSKHCCLFVL